MGGSGIGPGDGAAAEVRIRPARLDETERLREIARAAKGHWGYDPDRVRDWASTLDYAPDAVPGRELFVADRGGRAVGVATLIAKGTTSVLDELWIDPPSMGFGIGSRLFHHAAGRARVLGAGRLVLEAEPHAVGFYEKLGARRIGESEPGAWGRRLPLMALDLE